GAEPAERDGSVGCGKDFIGETRLDGGEVVLRLGEDALGGLIGVAADEPAGAAGGLDADGAAATVEGVGAVLLVEVPDEGGGAAMEGDERLALARVAVEQGELAGSEVVVPEPIDRPGDGAVERLELVERVDGLRVEHGCSVWRMARGRPRDGHSLVPRLHGAV